MQWTHGHQLAHTTTDFVVRVIASAVTTHVVFVVHYQLHATTTFLTNSSVPVEYLSECRMSRFFYPESQGCSRRGTPPYLLRASRISLCIDVTMAIGSGAVLMGLPTTIWSAPFSIAPLAVTMRF